MSSAMKIDAFLRRGVIFYQDSFWYRRKQRIESMEIQRDAKHRGKEFLSTTFKAIIMCTFEEEHGKLD